MLAVLAMLDPKRVCGWLRAAPRGGELRTPVLTAPARGEGGVSALARGFDHVLGTLVKLVGGH